MPGKWIRKKPDPSRVPHTCKKPLIFPWRRTGAVWECSCGQRWYIRESWTDGAGYTYWREWSTV